MGSDGVLHNGTQVGNLYNAFEARQYVYPNVVAARREKRRHLFATKES